MWWISVQDDLEYGSLPQSKETVKDFWSTEANSKVTMTSPLFWAPFFSLFYRLFVLPLANKPFFFLRFLSGLILVVTLFLPYFLTWSFLLTSFQYEYLCCNIMTCWKNPQVLQNCTALIGKRVWATCSKPVHLCNLSATETINGPRDLIRTTSSVWTKNVTAGI